MILESPLSEIWEEFWGEICSAWTWAEKINSWRKERTFQTDIITLNRVTSKEIRKGKKKMKGCYWRKTEFSHILISIKRAFLTSYFWNYERRRIVKKRVVDVKATRPWTLSKKKKQIRLTNQRNCKSKSLKTKSGWNEVITWVDENTWKLSKRVQRHAIKCSVKIR